MSLPNTPYHEPAQLNARDIGTNQTETIGLTFDQACGNIKIVAVWNGTVIKTWTEANGITVAADRLSASYELSGQELIKATGMTAILQFSIWRQGVVELEQKISVVKTYV